MKKIVKKLSDIDKKIPFSQLMDIILLVAAFTLQARMLFKEREFFYLFTTTVIGLVTIAHCVKLRIHIRYLKKKAERV